jgi:hypothetical protein
MGRYLQLSHPELHKLRNRRGSVAPRFVGKRRRNDSGMGCVIYGWPGCQLPEGKRRLRVSFRGCLVCCAEKFRDDLGMSPVARRAYSELRAKLKRI